MAKEDDDAAIDLELSETKDGVSLYGFSNDETAGKTLYLYPKDFMLHLGGKQAKPREPTK